MMISGHGKTFHNAQGNWLIMEFYFPHFSPVIATLKNTSMTTSLALRWIYIPMDSVIFGLGNDLLLNHGQFISGFQLENSVEYIFKAKRLMFSFQ